MNPGEQPPLEKVISPSTSTNSDSLNPVEDLVKTQPVTIDDLFDMEPEWEREEADKTVSGRKRTKDSAGSPQKKTGKINLDEVDLSELGL